MYINLNYITHFIGMKKQLPEREHKQVKYV